MTTPAELVHLKREHVIAAIDGVDSDQIGSGERFSTLYKGRRYDPKQLLAQAYLYAVGTKAQTDEWSDLAYTPFIEVLDTLDFRTVQNPKKEGDINLSAMVYEVKSPAVVQANYDKLFSSDRSRFYWNSNKFNKLKTGDPVFVVNAKAHTVLYCLVETLSVPAKYDHEKDHSTFSHNGESYSVAGQWQAFVSLKVHDEKKVRDAWRWKTLGSAEHTYISGSDVSVSSALNNIERVNLLLEAFSAYSDAEVQLQACFQALKKKVPVQTLHTHEKEPKVWFVMQGKTFSPERGQKYLWAPLKDKRGLPQAHWEALTEVKPGDIIVHNSNGGIQGISLVTALATECEDPFGDASEWRGLGRKVDIAMQCLLEPAITPDDLRRYQIPLAQALDSVRGPFNAQGTGNQGYLYEFTWEALAILLNNKKVALPDSILQWLPQVEVDLLAQSTTDLELNRLLPTQSTQLAASEWLPKVQAYIASKGFDYSLADVANFYLAICSKPLVILAGISGTGKTQLVRQFAKAIGYGDDRHCVLIPVRPDWTDNSDLIGYRNIQGKFEQQKLLKVLQDALAHPDEPFFVILDEMNLARVEHYFSDFLSVMETRERNSDNMIVTNSVLTDDTVNHGVPVTIPQNLIIVGTVNMDETTHPFSRKVLDRANAIEMNHIDLSWGTHTVEQTQPISGIYADMFVSPYLNSIELTAKQKLDLASVVELLVRINAILEPAGLHFGYRVRDELAFYLCQHAELEFSKQQIMTAEDALDYQLMQKVLPRIQGSALSVLTVLIELLKELSGAEITLDMELPAVIAAIKKTESNVKYPRSVKKLQFMLQRFNDDGFTSFWL